MELKVNAAILGALAIVWATLSLAEPRAALDPTSPETRALAAMEDRFARDRDDMVLAEALADAYLELDRPDLVVATLTSASPEVQSDPRLAHRLARGFERSGRVEDALAVAHVAVARCARSLGTSDSSAVTPLPLRACSERTYIALDMHRNALARMHAWGVTDPRTDSRAELAHAMSVRAARILSAQASAR